MARNDDEVDAPRRGVRDPQAKRFAQQPLPAISANGVAHFSGDAEPEPRRAKVVESAVNEQDIVAHGDARIVDGAKLMAGAQAMPRVECLWRGFGRRFVRRRFDDCNCSDAEGTALPVQIATGLKPVLRVELLDPRQFLFTILRRQHDLQLGE